VLVAPFEKQEAHMQTYCKGIILNDKKGIAGFEVLSAVVMNIYIFWDISA
jgi:hypothetical protein